MAVSSSLVERKLAIPNQRSTMLSQELPVGVK